MIRFLINNNEVFQADMMMKLNIGKEIFFLGTRYRITNVEVQETCTNVHLVHEKDYEARVNRVQFGGSGLNLVSRPNRNPFI